MICQLHQQRRLNLQFFLPHFPTRSLYLLHLKVKNLKIKFIFPLKLDSCGLDFQLDFSFSVLGSIIFPLAHKFLLAGLLFQLKVVSQTVPCAWSTPIFLRTRLTPKQPSSLTYSIPKRFPSADSAVSSLTIAIKI